MTPIPHFKNNACMVKPSHPVSLSIRIGNVNISDFYLLDVSHVLYFQMYRQENQIERRREEVASDEEIRKMIEEIERLRRALRNLKAKARRRVRKLGETSDQLHRQQIAYEIGLLRGEIRKLEIAEMKMRIPLINALPEPSEEILEVVVDWSKAGKA